MIVDKPQGWTSHDVVAKLRRIAGTRRVGHAGTLDPMATGVLVVGIDKATKLLSYVVGTSKTYSATIRLGQTTMSDDADGEITSETDASHLVADAIAEQAGKLTGAISQVPSSVSAIKVNGERAYARVRAGEDVQLQAREVSVHSFTIDQTRRVGQFIDLDVVIECSAGTYIRAIARDLGAALGVGGHLTALRRTAVGPFNESQSHSMASLEHSFDSIGIDEAVRALLPTRVLSADEAREISFGRRISAGEVAYETVAAVREDGATVALLTDPGPAGHYAKPKLVLEPA